MNKDGNSLSTRVGYWHKPHLLWNPETQPTPRSVQTSIRKAETKAMPGDARAGTWVLPSASPPEGAGVIPTPAVSPGHVDLSLLGREKGGKPVAQLL